MNQPRIKRKRYHEISSAFFVWSRLVSWTFCAFCLLQRICKLVAICLHYFFCASFSWMFVEGLHMYRRLREKRNIDTGKMSFYYFMGWGKWHQLLNSVLSRVIPLDLEYRGYVRMRVILLKVRYASFLMLNMWRWCGVGGNVGEMFKQNTFSKRWLFLFSRMSGNRYWNFCRPSERRIWQ